MDISSLGVVYRAQDLVTGQDVAVKLEHCTRNPSSLEHEFQILKDLCGGIGFPQPMWFGKESSYHALVLSNIATPVYDELDFQGLGVDVVLILGSQLVRTARSSWIVVLHLLTTYSTAPQTRIHPLTQLHPP